MPVKTLGMIGGIGPESTIDYYRLILKGYGERVRDGSAPPLLINSIDVRKLLALAGSGELAALTDYLVEELTRLARGGAAFGLFASNTPHIVFEAVQRQSPIPLLSIVEVTRDAAATLGLTRVGLFGTRFTMRGGFYPEVFRNHGITVVVPGSDDLDYIHDKYIQELLAGVVREGTRERFLAIAEGLRQQEGIQGLILGGTELPFLLRDSALPGVPFLDTTRIHAERAVQEMLAG